LPLPPWPACTNQSRPKGVSTLSVAFFTSFCIEIEPSEQVVWLWKSPDWYVPEELAALTTRGATTTAGTASAAATAIAIRFLLAAGLITNSYGGWKHFSVAANIEAARDSAVKEK